MTTQPPNKSQPIELCPNCSSENFAIVRDMTSLRRCPCGAHWPCPSQPLKSAPDIDENDFHGCLTGDCPHGFQSDCDAALKDHWKEAYDNLQAKLDEAQENGRQLSETLQHMISTGSKQLDKLQAENQRICESNDILRAAKKELEAENLALKEANENCISRLLHESRLQAVESENLALKADQARVEYFTDLHDKYAEVVEERDKLAKQVEILKAGLEKSHDAFVRIHEYEDTTRVQGAMTSINQALADCAALDKGEG